jgi:hypothetical protein
MTPNGHTDQNCKVDTQIDPCGTISILLEIKQPVRHPYGHQWRSTLITMFAEIRLEAEQVFNTYIPSLYNPNSLNYEYQCINMSTKPFGRKYVIKIMLILYYHYF